MDKEKLMTEEEWLAKYNASHKKSKKKNVRKWLRNGVALGLVAVLSIAGTLAYLQKQSNTKTNTFVGSGGLKLSLTESNWDQDHDDDPDSGEPFGDAQSYESSATYLKNPQLVNQTVSNVPNWNLDSNNENNVNESDATSNSTGSAGDYAYTEYVALEMDLRADCDGDGNLEPVSYSLLTSNIIEEITFNSGWELIAYGTTSNGTTTWTAAGTGTYLTDSKLVSAVNGADKFVFGYKAASNGVYTVLNADCATSALFSQIDTKDTIKSLTGSHEELSGDFPSFTITLKGAAVDSTVTDYDTGTTGNQAEVSDITTALLKLLGITITP